jgi:hypothetical protein
MSETDLTSPTQLPAPPSEQEKELRRADTATAERLRGESLLASAARRLPPQFEQSLLRIARRPG